MSFIRPVTSSTPTPGTSWEQRLNSLCPRAERTFWRRLWKPSEGQEPPSTPQHCISPLPPGLEQGPQADIQRSSHMHSSNCVAGSQDSSCMSCLQAFIQPVPPAWKPLPLLHLAASTLCFALGSLQASPLQNPSLISPPLRGLPWTPQWPTDHPAPSLPSTPGPATRLESSKGRQQPPSSQGPLPSIHASPVLGTHWALTP